MKASKAEVEENGWQNSHQGETDDDRTDHPPPRKSQANSGPWNSCNPLKLLLPSYHSRSHYRQRSINRFQIGERFT